MIGIVLISTAWGRNMGGINSINYGLTKALGLQNQQNIDIYCIITDNIPDAEMIEETKNKFNVKLLGLKDPYKSKNLENIINNFDYTFFVGHDVITGDIALLLRKKFINSTSVIINHMDYSSYYYLRDNNPKNIEQKEKKQTEIISKADIIFSIGPLLKKSAEDIVRKSANNSKSVYMLIPGLEEIKPNDISPNKHNILIFGRVEDKNNKLKQYNLALDAIGKYIKKEKIGINQLSINVYGYENVSEADQDAMQKRLRKSSGKTVAIKVHNYINDDEELFSELRNSSLCIMPSTTEGFGLVAYEAIAAGVPIIISRNSGLYEFLCDEVGKSNSDEMFPNNHLMSIDIEGNPDDDKSYTENDLKNLTNCITSVLKNYEHFKEKSLELRQLLIDKHYSWNFMASQFLQIIKEYDMSIFNIRENENFGNYENNDDSNTKKHYKLKNYFESVLLPRFCKAIMNNNVLTKFEIKNAVCKVIAYSNNRDLRLTILSSVKKHPNRTSIRKIDSGTVGIMNGFCIENKYFPVVFTDFVKNKCYYMSDGLLEEVKDLQIGYADHHVLSIIAIPLYSENSLIGAITFDIYDSCFINDLHENMDKYNEMLKYLYSELQIFSASVSDFLLNEFEDDVNFSKLSSKELNIKSTLGGNFMLENRKIISFGGKCPFDCKHCFGCEIDDSYENEVEIDDLVASLQNQNFDVLYISQNKENLINPYECIELCEKLFEEYCCDIFITTRCVLNDNEINQFLNLSRKMKDNNKNLTICVSIPALDSFSKTENIQKVPTPNQRLDFLKKIKNSDIYSMITIRPLFPNNFIPQTEIHQLVDECKDKVDCILTGGLMVTDKILKRLGVEKSEFNYFPCGNSEYLKGIDVDFMAVDVADEMKDLKEYCNKNGILFFAHSMDALNYFKSNPKLINQSE